MSLNPESAIHEPPPDGENPPQPKPKWHAWLRWRYLLLAGFWLGMFIGTHLPKVPQPLRKISDKTMHGSGFAFLAYLLTWATYRKPMSATRHWIFILTSIAVYGALDELLQIPVGRHCDFNDWLADMAGAFVGLSMFYLGLRCRMPNSGPLQSNDG
ncbi:MAG: VanZ like family protein [Planctomycetaceae bacterium]|nr:VanZ like family protein [Planctomycetaceae bacterium]